MRSLVLLFLAFVSSLTQAGLLPPPPPVAPRIQVLREDAPGFSIHVLEVDDQHTWTNLASSPTYSDFGSFAFGDAQLYVVESRSSGTVLWALTKGQLPSGSTHTSRTLHGLGVFSVDEAMGYDATDGSIVVLSPRGESTIVPKGVLAPGLRNVTVGRMATDVLAVLASDATGAGMSVVQFDVAKGTAQKTSGMLLPRLADTRAIVDDRGVIFVTLSKDPKYVEYRHVPFLTAPNVSSLLYRHLRSFPSQPFQPLARIDDEFFSLHTDAFARINTVNVAGTRFLGHDLFGNTALEAATKGKHGPATLLRVLGAADRGTAPYQLPLQQMHSRKVVATDPVQTRFAALWKKAHERNLLPDAEPPVQLPATALAVILEQLQMDADWLNVALRELGTYKEFGLDFRGYWFALSTGDTTDREAFLRAVRGAPSCGKLVAAP